MIHREGFKLIFLFGILLFGINAVVQKFIPAPELVYQILGIASLIFFLLIVQFFRNPTRYTPINENHIIAPADGKVVVIEEVEETEYFHDKRIQISIFMSPLNVHVNRNPVSGKVKYAKYHPGKYLVAWHPKSSTENERTTIVIEEPIKQQEVLFRQIAGAVARRIVYYVEEGQMVKQGSEMGFIKFGSRIDILLPLGSKVNVKIGDKTKGGETVIAELS